MVDFQLELWKYKSKIADFIDEMEKFTISLNSVVRSYLAKKHVILSKAERYDLARQLEDLIEHLKSMKRNIIDRFRFTNRRCKAMSTRVKKEYYLITEPDENPEYKKILHPELNHDIVDEFIDQCQDLVVCTQKVVNDFGILECRLRVVQKDSVVNYRFTEYVLMWNYLSASNTRSSILAVVRP